MVFKSRKGQITLLDLVIVPIIAVVLALIAVMVLQGSVANIVNKVNMQPEVDACNFELDSLFSMYYVHQDSALQYLKYYHPNQYTAAVSNSLQKQITNCGNNCSISYNTLPNSLGDSPDLYVDFIQYFTPFAYSVFNLTVADEISQLDAANMQVFLNQVPPLSYTPSQICSITVYNPEQPNSSYTVYGVVK